MRSGGSALSLRRWWRSAGFAWAGVAFAYRSQANFRVEVWAGALALGFALWLRVPLARLADITLIEGPSTITREWGQRRIVVTFVDLGKRPIALGELRRFSDRLGAAALLDTTPRRHEEASIASLRMDDAAIVVRLLADPRLLRLPLVRHGSAVTVGRAEAIWTSWLRPAAGR